MSSEASSHPVQPEASTLHQIPFNGTTGAYAAGVALFLCALVFYYFAVLRIDFSKTALLDLGPYTDATEYFAQARGLQTEGWPQLQIGFDKLPSKVSFGYPALMLGWLKVLPEEQAVLAPFRTNQTIGLVVLLVVFATYLYFGMPATGGCAALLLATLPAFFTFCRSSMSDISAGALFVLAFIFTDSGLNQQRRWQIYLAAFFLGLSLNVRPQAVFIAPLLLAMAVFPARGSLPRWFFHCIGALGVFVLGASPILALNLIQFHSPFKTGYYFWVPNLMEKHLLFSFQNIPSNIARLWSQLSLGPRGFDATNIFGTGTMFVPPFALLVLTGVAFLRLTRFVVCAFLAGLTYFAITATVIFGSGRLYLSLLVLLVAVAVLPLGWAAKNLRMGKNRIAALCVLGLFVLSCLGYPSNSGWRSPPKLQPSRFQAWEAVHFTSRPRRSPRFVAMNYLRQELPPGIVLSDIDPVYLNALLPKPFVAAPLDEKHHYRFSEAWRYGRPEAVALLKRGLDQSLPVYALFVSSKELSEKASRLPRLNGFEWSTLVSGSEAVVLTLTNAAADGGRASILWTKPASSAIHSTR